VQVTDQIYDNTTTITSYKIATDFPDVDTSVIGEKRIVRLPLPTPPLLAAFAASLPPPFLLL
jgi:hypothetical protein